MSQPKLPSSCPMTMGGKCNLPARIVKEILCKKPYAFLMLPYEPHFNVVETIFRTVTSGGRIFAYKFKPKEQGSKVVKAIAARTERFVGQGYCEICHLCWFSDFGLAELASINSNVMIEIGLMWGFAKRVIFTLDTSRTGIDDLPFDLRNYLYVTYNDVERLGPNLEPMIVYLLKTL